MRIREWLHDDIPGFLMFDEVVSETSENGHIESLDLAFCLWIISCCCQVFNTEDGAHLGKCFSVKMSTIGSEGISRNDKRD